MEPLYNIMFAGELLEGQQLAEVRTRLGKLFNADPQTLDRLFSGKTQTLKRDCDKATALKYKQAIERAGARPIIQSSQEAGASPAPVKPAPKTMTAAERIAALAAAPDEDRYRASADGPGVDSPVPAPAAAPGDPDLAPVGADLLRPEERHQPVTREVDIAGLEVAAPAQRLSPEPAPAPPAPDTSHLDMGNVGETIPNLAAEAPPPPPETLGIDLAPEGEDFSEFATPAAEEPLLDLSDMALAPAGSDVLEDKYRQRGQAEAPATDHISLED